MVLVILLLVSLSSLCAVVIRIGDVGLLSILLHLCPSAIQYSIMEWCLVMSHAVHILFRSSQVSTSLDAIRYSPILSTSAVSLVMGSLLVWSLLATVLNPPMT